MRANFTNRARVAELGDARSYASRLFDYGAAGRDQIAWVVETLTRDPAASYATITIFEPLSDTLYVPCVSRSIFGCAPAAWTSSSMRTASISARRASPISCSSPNSSATSPNA